MTRFLTPLCALLLVAAGTPSPAADAKKISLRWFGQSFVSLETPAGARIVFDPHAIEAFGRNSMAADLILVSHFHDDHTRLEVISNYDKAEKVFGLKGAGKKVDWNLMEKKYAFKSGEEIKVRNVGVYHDETQGMERGKNSVFIIEIAGIKICHLGDLGHLLTKDQIEKIGAVDVLLIPVGGVYTINGSEAKKVVAQLKPRLYIVPMHFGTKNFTDVLTVDEFLDDQKKERVRRETGNELIIKTDAKASEPDIVVLNPTPK